MNKKTKNDKVKNMNKVKKFIQEKNLISHGEHIIVGVSGGADSVCLLLILHSLQRELDLKITAVHINHMIRTEAVDGGTASAFIVFSADSTRLELFFSDEQPNEILERRGLPSGGYAWNVEDDDTKNVRLIDGLWTISQRDKLIYTQKGGS